MTTEEKIQAFAKLLEKERMEWMDAEGYTHHRGPNVLSDIRQGSFKASIKPGKKYTKVDFNGSGYYMIDGDKIFGIKAYGVIHRGHYYGTLDEIHNWNWGGYKATKKT